MCEVINYCIAEGENVKDKIPDVFKVTEPDKIKEIEIENVLLIDYDNKKIFVCWIYDVDDRHVEAIHTIWTGGWEAKRQNSGIAFNCVKYLITSSFKPSTICLSFLIKSLATLIKT